LRTKRFRGDRAMAQVANPNEETIAQLENLLQAIEAEPQPSDKTLKGWLVIKDGLVKAGKHHAKRDVTRGQIKGDVEKAIAALGGVPSTWKKFQKT
jgi:hypothetical protein